jgi:hypothetical protein
VCLPQTAFHGASASDREIKGDPMALARRSIYVLVVVRVAAVTLVMTAGVGHAALRQQQ